MNAHFTGCARALPRVFTLLVLALGLSGASGATAERYRLTLDPERTRIAFTLGATLHTVRGTFAMRSAEVRFDSETGEASGQIVVDARSGDTGIDQRDAVMHEEVLASEEHPRLVLSPERIEGIRREPDALSGTLHGRFEVRGASHPIALAFEGTRDGADARVEAHFTVPWVAWGLPDPSNWLLSVEKTLEVRIETRGALEWNGPE